MDDISLFIKWPSCPNYNWAVGCSNFFSSGTSMCNCRLAGSLACTDVSTRTVSAVRRLILLVIQFGSSFSDYTSRPAHFVDMKKSGSSARHASYEAMDPGSILGVAIFPG